MKTNNLYNKRMQSASNPTLDANAQHPPEIRADDPRHLKNLTSKMNSINSQVSTDTKYDPAPPPRVDRDGKVVKESFVANVPVTDLKLKEEFLHLLRAGTLLVFVGILVTIFDPDLRKYLLSSQNGVKMLLAAFVISCITMIIIGITQNKIISDMWYPYQV